MQNHDTRFIHIYGYGLVVLWLTFWILAFIWQIITQFPDIRLSLGYSLLSVLYLSLFAMPVAAIITLLISGTVWLPLKRAPLNNSMRAMIAGGLSGSLIILPFTIADLSNNQFNSLYLFISLFLLGAWSGWVGERWARRHVKINPESVANAFD